MPAAALQHAAVAAAAAGQPQAARRRLGRPPSLVAHGRRPRQGKEAADAPAGGNPWEDDFPAANELSPQLAAEKARLVELMPDPADDESLLDESGWGGAASPTGSGADWDWNPPLGGSPEFADYGFGPGGAADDLGGDPFASLQSQDYTADLVREVGEGNSFRREQRERYGAPFRNMTNLAHATEDELLASAEVQTLREDQVERVMSDALALHHYHLEHAVNKYAVAVRFGELLEELEYDELSLPPEDPAAEAAREAVPAWCRAAFAMADEFEALNEAAAINDALLSEQEMAFFREEVQKQLRSARGSWELEEAVEQTPLGPAGGAAAPPPDDDLLADMFVGLPGVDDDGGYGDEGEAPESAALAASLLGEGVAGQPGLLGDYLSKPLEVLAGDALGDLFGEDEEEEGGMLGLGGEEEEESEASEDDERGGGAAAAAGDDEGGDAPAAAGAFAEDDEAEEEEEGGHRGGHRGPRLPSHFKERKQAAAERERQSAERMGLRPPSSSGTQDPILRGLHLPDP